MRVLEVVVVNGYGCNLDSPLRPHLDHVVAYLEENMVGCVAFCGGFTQQEKFPGKSEAEVMADYVLPRLSQRPIVLIEEDSYTTFENAKNSARAIRAAGWEPDRLTQFCEATRALKVAILARHFFTFIPGIFDVFPNGERRFHIMTDSWELANPLKEVLHVIVDVFCCHVPGLWRYFRWRRIRKARQA